jgi:hypothetical protein
MFEALLAGRMHNCQLIARKTCHRCCYKSWMNTYGIMRKRYIECPSLADCRLISRYYFAQAENPLCACCLILMLKAPIKIQYGPRLNEAMVGYGPR